MKIGILTLPLHTNYGGILQAYALQTVLERMGNEVVVLDKGWPDKISIKKKTKRVLRYFYNRFNGRETGRFMWALNQENEIYKERLYTGLFIKKYINQRVVSNLYSIEENEFDAFVVGSDQVWRVHHIKPIENAFLDFTHDWNVKRIAYAPSFGTKEWEYNAEQTEKCSLLLHKFNAVSVREKYGCHLCNIYFNHKAKHVLDPTMLLSPEYYIHQLKIRKIEKSEGQLLLYILDMTQKKLLSITAMEKLLKMSSFTVNSKCEDKKVSISHRIQPPVEKWLRGFEDCKFVVTDSFHACVFAILFNKPFLVFGNKERGLDRLESLLELFDLKNRMLESNHDMEHILNTSIDWMAVNEKLNVFRIDSLSFLEKALVN